MQTLLLMIHILVIIALMILVLMQPSNSGSMGAAMGSGSAHTLFGSKGATPFLAKLTALLLIVFFATSLLLGHSIGHQKQSQLLLKHIPHTKTTPNNGH